MNNGVRGLNNATHTVYQRQRSLEDGEMSPNILSADNVPVSPPSWTKLKQGKCPMPTGERFIDHNRACSKNESLDSTLRPYDYT